MTENNSTCKQKKLFHLRHPLLDFLFNFGETDVERVLRHLELENPEEYQIMMDRFKQQMKKLRESEQGTGSIGPGG